MRPILTVVVLLSCLAPVLGAAGRLGDFEWAARLAPDERAQFDDQVAHSGKYSLRYQTAATDKAPTRASFVVAETFETAEFEVAAWIKLEGKGSLRLFYPGDGRNAVEVIESPTDGWQPLKLHLRANPERDAGEVYRLELQASLSADSGQVTWWLDDVFVTPLYQLKVPKITKPPVIDGELSDACWNDESYAGDPYWRMYNKARDAKEPTHVWCCYDDEHLYVAFRCATRAPGKLVTKVTKHDGPAWRDDSAEIFFNPSHDHARYYEYIVTPKEVVFDSKWFREGGLWQVDWGYFGKWRTAIEKDAWTVEIALDLRSYEERDLQGNPTGYMPLPTGDVAGILFSRNDRVLGEGMSWADCIGSFHEVHQYGHLVGFRPNYVAGYRKYAVREIDRLQQRWEKMYYEAGCPAALPAQSEELQDGTETVLKGCLRPSPRYASASRPRSLPSMSGSAWARKSSALIPGSTARERCWRRWSCRRSERAATTEWPLSGALRLRRRWNPHVPRTGRFRPLSCPRWLGSRQRAASRSRSTSSSFPARKRIPTCWNSRIARCEGRRGRSRALTCDGTAWAGSVICFSARMCSEWTPEAPWGCGGWLMSPTMPHRASTAASFVSGTGTTPAPPCRSS